MRNFVKYTLAFAICAVALLSSCIKEESYEVHELMLDANITRATTSSEQGDQINDVMIWAFNANNSYNKVGWVSYTAPANTYKDITVHVPVKICGDAGSTYRLVAVINKDKFKNTVTFDSNTTYQELIAASFDNRDLIAENLVETNNPGNPAVMPISHWCDVSVTKDDYGKHKHVDMKVFRSVAKTHFYITKKSEFAMNVTTLELHNGCLPTGGMVLSNSTVLESDNATPSWFSTNGKIPATVSATTLVDNLITSPVAVVEGMVDETENRDGANLDLIKYQLVGSKLIYETNKTATVTTDYGSVTETSGYYYKIGYTVGDGAEYIRYFALPQIARNHDYQVRARVDAGGELTFTVIVNDWEKQEIEMDYKDVATVTDDGYIKWTSLPKIGDDTVWNQKNANDQVENGIIKLASSEGSTATFTFGLKTPLGGDWIAELRPSQGKPGSIVFVTTDEDGNKVYSSTLEGDIDGEELNTITITTLEDNLIVNNGIENIAVLYITARGTWADQTEHSYIVDGIVGEGVDFKNYTISQPAQ